MPALMPERNFALALSIGSIAIGDTRRVHGDPGIPPDDSISVGKRRPGGDGDAVLDSFFA